MKVIFFGTPEIAVASLEALHGIADVVGVVCQPDRPSGRGLQLQSPAIKRCALRLQLPVYQPEKVRDGALAAWMRSLSADLALVLAYGRILPPEVLTATRLGCVNLHASLLPEYRGAAPIVRALMDGRDETGMCLMQMDAGMDTGPVLSSRSIPILPHDNAATLTDRLSHLGAQITTEDLPRFLRGELTPQPQDERRATHAAPLTKADTSLDFARPASELANQVRALSPRPGAQASFERHGKSTRLKVLQAHVADVPLALRSGEVGAEQGHLYVGTGRGQLELIEVQMEGRRAQTGTDVLNGRLLTPGLRLYPLDLETRPGRN